MADSPEMVERIAKAIGDGDVPYNPFDFRSMIAALFVISNGPSAISTIPKCVDYLLNEIARLALQAAREPTEAMVVAASDISAWSRGSIYGPIELYQAMIDAALHPRTSPEQGSE